MASYLRKIPIKHFTNIIKRNKSSRSKQKKQDYLIVRPTPEDFEGILCLMEKFYYPYEPTCQAVGFKPTIIHHEHVLRSLCEGYSLVAKCKFNGDILGAAVNETTNPWDPDIKDKLACKVSDVKSRQLLHFYAYMQRVPDLWRKYNTQKIFEIAYLFTRRDQRKKGIALKLAEASRDVAADCGFSLVRMDATSFYSSKLAEKMKMKLVGEIPYCSYVGADQRPIFNPPDPHKSVKIYIDDEPQINSVLKK